VGFDARASPERQEFIRKMNELIRPLAAEERAVLVDLEAALLEEGNLADLFVDHIHPNDAGYEIIASEFFAAITRPAAMAAAAPAPEARAFGLLRPPPRAPTGPRAKPGWIAGE
jgi:hypothetical protein